MIEIIDKALCTGCAACFSACPLDCITMENDQEGFWYPIVDSAVCNECGVCERVCPLLRQREIPRDRIESPIAFAAWNKDDSIRLESTSGGVFSALATTVYKRGGCVSGAVYDSSHHVVHMVSEVVEDLPALRSSKYLQSNINRVFRTIIGLLTDGHEVFFVGTPCQVAGLYHLLGKDHDNLITCDFICRGVNSPEVFLKYIKMLEEKYHAKVIRIKFKNKTYGWHRFSTKVEFENGRVYIKDRYHDPFMRGYLEYNCYIRPSCYACQFKGMPRQADITLADFWGIESHHPEWDNDRGTSAIIINSLKGFRVLQDSGEQLEIHDCSIGEIANGNFALEKATEIKQGRTKFFLAIHESGFGEAFEKNFPSPKTFTIALNRIAAISKMILKRVLGI
jgi:coenzyme F420-reducing hydrogenase beta subunit